MYMVLDSNWIKKYAYIKHDKDDGKVEHIHLMCSMAPSTTKTKTIMNKFGIRENQIEKIKGTWDDAVDYLTHSNAPNKYQYDSDEVVSNYDWLGELESNKKKKNRREEIIERICNGEIRRYNETDEITPIEHDKYYVSIDRAYKYRNSYVMAHLEEIVKMKNIVWVYGKSGTGKTTLAKMLAKEMNLFYRLTSTGKNMFDEYQDEPCIIMDDLRPDNISFIDLLGILDPYNFKSAYARYKNKALQAELVIVTTIYSPMDFVRQYNDKMKLEEEKQLYRRINQVYKVTDDEVTVSEFDDDNINLVFSERYPNVFKYIRDNKKEDKVKNSFDNMMQKLVLS